MQRYFIKLSYNGANYHGWQVQNNANTVQAEVEKALAVLLSGKIEITGAGRTDTGVHAKEYFVHFDWGEKLNTAKLSNVIYRMNAILPEDISVQNIFPVSSDAHARFSAISRTYCYYISRYKNPFKRDNAWNVYGNLDVERMNKASAILFEYSDFSCFAKLHSDVKTNHCKIMQAEWKEENSMLVFTIKADRFLRNMVRAIVGTIVDIGKGKISIEKFRKIIESNNRSEAGYSVPAQGLFLEEIKYPDSIFI
ncbi:MAG: tRNA pseudouridine(38-40) synthase TruA [Bacteroidota bacterium]